MLTSVKTKTRINPLITHNPQGLVGSEGEKRGRRDKRREEYLSEKDFCVVSTFGINIIQKNTMFYIFKTQNQINKDGAKKPLKPHENRNK